MPNNVEYMPRFNALYIVVGSFDILDFVLFCIISKLKI
jgi:hypothetical protein